VYNLTETFNEAMAAYNPDPDDGTRADLKEPGGDAADGQEIAYTLHQNWKASGADNRKWPSTYTTSMAFSQLHAP